jgi:hypothetical protein
MGTLDFVSYHVSLNQQPWPALGYHGLSTRPSSECIIPAGFRSSPSFPRLPANERGCDASDDYKYPLRGCVPLWRLLVSAAIIGGSLLGR